MIIGVDVGATKIRAGVVSSTGKILGTANVPTGTAKGKDAVLDNIRQAIASVWRDEVAGIGLGLAGIVDHETGVFISGPNFPATFAKIPIAALAKKWFGKPAAADNDVHCFALAEAVRGAGKGKRLVIGMTLGTGVGGGIIVGGVIERGRNNAAGEIGHMSVSDDERAVCGCGMTGHLEALASGTAMSALYKKATGKELDAFAVEKAFLAGDPVAKLVFKRMADGLATGLANLIHILNPDIIVIGGGIAKVDALVVPALKEYKAKLISPAIKTTPVERAMLGTDANVLGAALLVQN